MAIGKLYIKHSMTIYWFINKCSMLLTINCLRRMPIKIFPHGGKKMFDGNEMTSYKNGHLKCQKTGYICQLMNLKVVEKKDTRKTKNSTTTWRRKWTKHFRTTFKWTKKWTNPWGGWFAQCRRGRYSKTFNPVENQLSLHVRTVEDKNRLKFQVRKNNLTKGIIKPDV